MSTGMVAGAAHHALMWPVQHYMSITNLKWLVEHAHQHQDKQHLHTDGQTFTQLTSILTRPDEG